MAKAEKIEDYIWYWEVYFHILSDSLRADEVTDRLGMKPDTSFNKGEPRTDNPKIIHPWTKWTISLPRTTAEQQAFNNIDDLLKSLFDKLNNSKQQIRQLINKHQVIFEARYYTHEIAQSGGGDISSENIKRIAEFGGLLRIRVITFDSEKQNS